MHFRVPHPLGVMTLVACLWPLPSTARADEMDLTLSRLRIIGGMPGCENITQAHLYCADNELYERLMSEFAVSLAPTPDAAARGLGERGFYFGLSTTMTSIESDSIYWGRGTEGDAESARQGLNDSPEGAIFWNRLKLRKGLPFGFDVGSSVGHALHTSMWTLGGELRWSLFEGFRTGLGQLPDLAVRGSVATVVGSNQVSVVVQAIDFTISKPLVVEQAVTISPLLGVQTIFVSADSATIDLTPGLSTPTNVNFMEDAFRSCEPLPGHQVGVTGGEAPATLVCSNAAGQYDYRNNLVFDSLRQTRWRMFLGAELKYDVFVGSMGLSFDLSRPDLATTRLSHIQSDKAAGQVALNLSVGVSP